MFPWPKEVKGTSIDPLMSMVTYSSSSSKSVVIPRLNINGVTSNMDKEIAIHFSNNNYSTIKEKLVDIRNIILHPYLQLTNSRNIFESD